MKKLIILTLLVVVALSVTSCATTYDKKAFMKGEAAFSAEPNSMWARPTEIGYEIVGDVEGTAEFSKLFGYIPLGDSPAAAGLTGIFGTGADNVGARCAAYDALKTIGADGIYITSIYTTTTSGIVTKETVTVKGKALKLVDLGTVDQERADAVRYLNANGGLDKGNLAPNVGTDGAFGALGGLFSFGF